MIYVLMMNKVVIYVASIEALKTIQLMLINARCNMYFQEIEHKGLYRAHAA